MLTLKVERNLDVLRIFIHTKNKAAIGQGIQNPKIGIKNIKIALRVKR